MISIRPPVPVLAQSTATEGDTRMVYDLERHSAARQCIALAREFLLGSEQFKARLQSVLVPNDLIPHSERPVCGDACQVRTNSSRAVVSGRVDWRSPVLLRQRYHNSSQRLSYSSWRRHQTPVSLRPLGARSSHGYMPQIASTPREYVE